MERPLGKGERWERGGDDQNTGRNGDCGFKGEDGREEKGKGKERRKEAQRQGISCNTTLSYIGRYQDERWVSQW